MPRYGITSRVENEKELVLEKIFDVPRERLFEMFSDTAHLEHFWGPHGWELIHSSMDFRTAGEWFYGMKDMNSSQENYGMESWGKTVYQEIEEPEKIIYVDYFVDKSGEINREMPASKTEMKFVELDKNRSILVSRTEYRSKEDLQKLMDSGLLEGVAEMWERLSEYVVSDKSA